jgi:uncharacterized protein (DUF1778 family)
MVTKDRRIGVRASTEQEELLRQAASETGKTLTDFVVESAVAEAERVLAACAVIRAPDDDFEAFQRLIDQPLPGRARVGELLSRPSAL